MIVLTALSLPFMMRAPIDLPTILSVELIQITDKTSIPFAAKATETLEKLKKEAQHAEFKPVIMQGLSLKARLNNTIRFASSHNVAGFKKGSLRPNEYILMMAHWDHLGIKEEQSGDNIYNGAVDNATGVAGILELAETLNDYDNERSLLYLAVTAEESGLLGSAYFAEYPPIDLSQVVAGYNFDAMHPRGKV